MIIRPQGKITVVAGTDITGDHSVALATAVHLKTKEMYRARWVKITNATDTRIVARRTKIQAIDATTGEPTHFEVIQNVETDNYPSIVIEVGETVYLEKNPGMTPVDGNGDYEVNQIKNNGQVYSLFQVDGAPGAGNVYASPVAILG